MTFFLTFYLHVIIIFKSEHQMKQWCIKNDLRRQYLHNSEALLQIITIQREDINENLSCTFILRLTKYSIFKQFIGGISIKNKMRTTNCSIIMSFYDIRYVNI